MCVRVKWMMASIKGRAGQVDNDQRVQKRRVTEKKKVRKRNGLKRIKSNKSNERQDEVVDLKSQPGGNGRGL